MKQKIFSLLVLMITTVCGAWAQDVESFISYDVTLYGECSDEHYDYNKSFIYGGALYASDGYLNIPFHLQNLLKAFDANNETASNVTIQGSVPGLSVVDNVGDKILKIDLTTANLSSDVEFYLELRNADEGIMAQPKLTLSVSHNEHSYSKSLESVSEWEWSYNATRHWTACDGYGKCSYAGRYDELDDGLWETDSFNEWAHSGAHADANSDGNCDVCGYAIPAPAHVHSFATTAWTTTATHHYHKCTGTGCPLNDDALTADAVAAVTLTADEETALAFATHDFTDGYCTSCGYDVGAGHVHVLDGYVQKTTYHYMKCTVSGCPYYGDNVSQDVLTAATTIVQGVIGYGTHASDTECPTCGYTPSIVIGHAHSFESDWHYIPEGHYHACTTSEDDTQCLFNSANGGYSVANLTNAAASEAAFAAHADANSDGDCDVCGYHVHAAANEWSVIGVGADGYHYHKCVGDGSKCNLTYTSFIASDWTTTYPWTLHAQHEDTNADGDCDVCGSTMSAHVHTPGTTYVQVGTDYHYAPCTDTTCPFHAENLTADDFTNPTDAAALNFGVHEDANSDGDCDACGYAIPAHVHVFGDWSETTDKQYHYKECSASGCTITDYTNMSDLQKAETSYGKHQYGTSQEGTAYYTCKICGIENVTRKAETHTHSYMWASIPTGTGATDDDPEHWQQCTSTVGACIADQPEAGDGPRKVPAEKKHQFVTTATDYTYYTCSVCGYIDEEKKATVPHGHVIDTETWASNDAAHYHECIGQGNCDITNYNSLPASVTAAQTTAIAYAEHTYGTSQQGAKYYTCQVCEYISETRRTEAHTHNYGEWQHDNVQHWKECSEAAGPCDAPKGSLGNHVYGTSGDARWTCSTCTFVNTARQAAILNAETAMNVQSWSWDYEIPFNFEAPVQNDRRFNANQCYTVILPYALELNGMKAYTIEQHNDKIVGFKEQAVTELTQLKPYILKSEATGNPLSMPMTTIYSTLLKSDNASDVAAWMTQAEKDALLDDRATVGNQPSINDGTSPLSMIGTLKYLKAEAVGLYILQGKDADHPNGVFKKVETAGGYDATGDNRASVLPMRAYLKATTSSPARLLSVVFYAADGSVTAVERLALDEDGLAVIYDLQGRRVQNPRKGGLYIINGRKSILK